MFIILQRESNTVMIELWTLVKNDSNEVASNASQQDYTVPPISTEQNEDDQEQVDDDTYN